MRRCAMITTIVSVAIICCCAMSNQIRDTPPARPAATQPATPAAAPIQAPEQNAQGQLAAAIAAQLSAQLTTSLTAKGVEYQSELPWKAVAYGLGLNAIGAALIALMLVLSHRREMARIKGAK
jgi:hypothetical protein